jgi:polyisoprenyl-teichoic acid--peptidoglycan teichoic acid transferase
MQEHFSLLSWGSLIRRYLWGMIIIIPLFLAGCGTPPVQAQSLATAWYLITLNPRATATPTPFQPIPASDSLLLATPFSTETPEVLPSPVNTFPPPDATPTPSMQAIIPTPGQVLDLSKIPTAMPLATGRDTINFLLLGSDTRSGASFRTDTMVVVIVRPSTGEVSLISLPRDLWVNIPTIGMQRLNTAYQFGDYYNYPGGGAQLLKDSIQYNLGITIDHTAMVDFDGFRQVVNTIGGVDVPVSCPYTDWHLISPDLDPENEYNWELYTVGPGVIKMDGDLALWYARSRKHSNDFDRGRRQQEVLRALYAQALRANLISHLPDLYSQVSSSITTDLSFTDLLSLAPLSLHLTNANIRSYYINEKNGTVSSWITPEGAYVLIPNEAAISALVQEAMTSHPRETQQAAVKIEVRNASPFDGWDSLAAQRLNYAGYESTIAPADHRDQTTSYLYDRTTSQDPSITSRILAVLGLTDVHLISAPNPNSSAPYVLLLGSDYAPCFDPGSLTP